MTDSENGLTTIAPNDIKAVHFQAGEESVNLSVKMVQDLLVSGDNKPPANDCIKFMMLCRARLLNPFEGDAYIIPFQGRWNLITGHQALLKRMETHPAYDGMDSGIIVETGEGVEWLDGHFIEDGHKLLGGWASIYRSDRTRPQKSSCTLKHFNKGQSVWNSNPELMICKCAEAIAIRKTFPSVTSGMYLREELEDDTPPADFLTAKTGTPTGKGTEKPARLRNTRRARLVDEAQGLGLEIKDGMTANYIEALIKEKWDSTEPPADNGQPDTEPATDPGDDAQDQGELTKVYNGGPDNPDDQLPGLGAPGESNAFTD